MGQTASGERDESEHAPSGQVEGGIASASRRHTPSLRSACRNSSRPPLRIGCRVKIKSVAMDRWQVEGKQRIVDHDGCGAPLIRDATCLDNTLLCESGAPRHGRHKIIIIRLEQKAAQELKLSLNTSERRINRRLKIAI